MSNLFILQIISFVIFLSSGIAIALIAISDLLSKIVIRKDYTQQRLSIENNTATKVVIARGSTTPNTPVLKAVINTNEQASQ